MLKNLKNKVFYHGSYTEVKLPDIAQCKLGKDFGRGFYLTTDKQQAVRFAQIVARRNNLSKGVVNSYMLSDFFGLDIYEFQTTDIHWLNCVVGFRSSRHKVLAKPYDHYDVLIGKIADDDTSQVINAYMQGAFGEVGSDMAIQMVVQRLLPNKLNNQICLKNEHALQRITFIESISVDVR